jgi:F0F1-type ATP synthase gamma subunit
MIKKTASKSHLLATTTIVGQPPVKPSCFTNMLKIKYCNGMDVQPACSHSPLLNLEPEQVLSHLTDLYLYAALHEVFYSSLMVENHMRLEHMNRAIHRLEKDVAGLRLRYLHGN